MVTIVVAGERAAEMLSHAKKIAGAQVLSIAAGANFSTALQAILAQSSGNPILLIDSNSLANSEDISKIATAAQGMTAAAAFLPLQFGEASMDSIPSTVEEIYSFISGGRQWPVAAAAVHKEFCAMIKNVTAESMSEAIGQILISAISEGQQIATLESGDMVAATGAPLLSGAAIARMLARTIQSNNIEELFPGSSWSTHQDESAALAYQKLAALFMRFGDRHNAAECLAQSEKLEDSPRTLALRGLLAEEQGQTLEAVAQMVSSLQRYEIRKKENAKHAVAFTPKNLDEINQNLYAGLDALNKRDNQTALQFFTKAVFNFDSFYEESGFKKR